MGQRCNMAIIEGGKLAVYYDHWAANRLDLELLFGPSYARKFIEERKPDPESWLDDVWAEGGCALNFDTKHMIWFGGEDTLYEAQTNQIVMDLMAKTWIGWRVEWAMEGIFDIARACGVPIETVSSNHQYESDKLSVPFTIEGDGKRFVYADMIASISDSVGQRSAALYADGLVYLTNRKVDIEKVSRLVDQSPLEPFLKRVTNAEWQGFTTGAHFDMTTKTLSMWSPRSAEGARKLFASNWLEWTVRLTGADYAWHQALIPNANWPDNDAGARLEILDQFQKQLRGGSSNPINSVVSALEKAGHSVTQINPATMQHRTSEPEIIAHKLALLDVMKKR